MAFRGKALSTNPYDDEVLQCCNIDKCSHSLNTQLNVFMQWLPVGRWVGGAAQTTDHVDFP